MCSSDLFLLGSANSNEVISRLQWMVIMSSIISLCCHQMGQCNLMEAGKARNRVEQAGSGREQAKVVGHHLRISTYGELKINDDG